MLAGTSCQNFSSSEQVWGVKINGQCLNINDTSAPLACEAFKAGADPEAVTIYRSDSCSGSELAIVSPATQCDTMESGGTGAWAVKIGNQCHNISDTAPALACKAFKSAASPYGVKIYRSDSCSSSLTAAVDYRTRCEDLRGLPDAWAVESNGRCNNISDIDIVQACERFKQ